jgi:hypothetical protein
VRVKFPREKAEEGVERSFRSRRKRPRGQRGGKTRSMRELSRCVPRPPAPEVKTGESRRVNHKGRVHLWAVTAANRIAARNPAKRLIEGLTDDVASAEWVEVRDHVLRSPAFLSYAAGWHVYSYKCRHVGARPEGRDPWHFLCLRAPRVGAEDLMSLVAHLAPRSERRLIPGGHYIFPEDAGGLDAIEAFCSGCGRRYWRARGAVRLCASCTISHYNLGSQSPRGSRPVRRGAVHRRGARSRGRS